MEILVTKTPAGNMVLAIFFIGGLNDLTKFADGTTNKKHRQAPGVSTNAKRTMKLPKDRVIIASDVNQRDGIGVEIYRDDKLIVEIFRDDTEKTRTVSIFTENISLELMEKSIEIFKKEIPWEFIVY